MKRKFVRVTISTILFLLFGICYMIYKDGAEKNKTIYFVSMIIFGVCFALFAVYARKFEEQDENDADRIEEEEENNEQINGKKFWKNRIFKNIFGWVLFFTIFLIFIIVNNGVDVVFSFLQFKWYYVVSFLFILPLFYFGSVYLGHLLLKLMWGNNYEHDAVTGLKKLRIFFGAGAIIVLFYISLCIYNSLK